LLAPSESIDDDDPHFNFYSGSIMQISNLLSPKLAIVEELLLVSTCYCPPHPPTPWRRFFELFHSVKVLRLQHDGVFDIAHSLQQDQEESVPVLPSLEKIVLYEGLGSPESDLEDEGTVMEAFGPFITARQQAGRPVKISQGKVYGKTWNFPRDFHERISEWKLIVCLPSVNEIPRFLTHVSIEVGSTCHVSAFHTVSSSLKVSRVRSEVSQAISQGVEVSKRGSVNRNIIASCHIAFLPAYGDRLLKANHMPDLSPVAESMFVWGWGQSVKGFTCDPRWH